MESRIKGMGRYIGKGISNVVGYNYCMLVICFL